MLMMFLISMLISIILLFLPMFFKKKVNIYSIESGFNNMNKISLKSFSVNFFFILIIFIMFDLELIFIFIMLFKLNIIINIFIILFFLITYWIELFMDKIKWIN